MLGRDRVAYTLYVVPPQYHLPRKVAPSSGEDLDTINLIINCPLPLVHPTHNPNRSYEDSKIYVIG